MRPVLMAPLFGLALLTEPHEHEDRFDGIDHGMHESEFENMVGIKLVGVGAIGNTEEGDDSGWDGLGGIGGWYEHTIVERWLEIEISAIMLRSATATHVPLDLLFKKPFHVTHVLNPYVGIGPALTFVIEDGRGGGFFGGVATVGTYLWLRERLGLAFAFDYAIVHEHGAVHELEGTFGLAFRY